MKIRKLGTKMFVGFGVVLALVVILVIVAWSVIQGTTSAFNDLIATEIKIQDLAREVNIQMLEARRNEKDFLARSDIKYADAAAANARNLSERAQAIKAIAEAAGFKGEAGQAENLAALASEYESIMARVGQTYSEMGLDETSGIRGQINAVSDSWSALLRELDGELPYMQYLLLRRWEKDYIRTSDVKYKDNLLKTLDLYVRAIETSTITEDRKKIQLEAVQAYRETFSSYLRHEVAGAGEAAQSAEA